VDTDKEPQKASGLGTALLVLGTAVVVVAGGGTLLLLVGAVGLGLLLRHWWPVTFFEATLLALVALTVAVTLAGKVVGSFLRSMTATAPPAPEADQDAAAPATTGAGGAVEGEVVTAAPAGLERVVYVMEGLLPHPPARPRGPGGAAKARRRR
jgi:hypothetical protein